MPGFFLLLLSSAALAADAPKQPLVPPEITAQVDKREAFVGDVVHLTVAVKHAEADAFEFPAEVSFGAFDLIDKAATQKIEGPMITEEMVFKLASYEVGEQSVAAIPFRIGGASFKTAEAKVAIKSVIDEEANEKKQKAPPPKKEGEPQQEAPEARKPDGDPFAVYERIYWPFYILGGVLLAAAIYLAAKRWRRGGTVQEVIAQAQIPPHKAALMLLRLLRDKQLLKQGRHREYYFEGTEILRGYLAQRYAINALDLTTAELMEKLAVISAPGLDREGLRLWLEHADFVKYAKMEPPAEKAASMLDFFEQQVWATRPPEPKAVEAA